MINELGVFLLSFSFSAAYNFHKKAQSIEIQGNNLKNISKKSPIFSQKSLSVPIPSFETIYPENWYILRIIDVNTPFEREKTPMPRNGI